MFEHILASKKNNVKPIHGEREEVITDHPETLPDRSSQVQWSEQAAMEDLPSGNLT